MHREYDDGTFLGAEAAVSLPFDHDDAADDWAFDAERDGWARHLRHGNERGAEAVADDNDDRAVTLRDAIRHVLELDWY